jgi:transcriptional regulator with PAS, ATPase and Fis domain
METIASVADTDANVLIIGESGTGKELIANALHERSVRRDGPWIKINCAALPKDLIESELFGHTKGSFTGATTEKVGLLEEAHKGSLLLDEITEMPIDLQAKLLRVLEDRVVRRLGGAKSIPVDFRLLSSTNRSPEQAVKEGQLRQDLYFRINTVTIGVPPLRERREDLPMLVRAFLERYRAKHQRGIDAIEPEAYRRLLSYAWPGNVRELQHALERAVLVARGREVTLADLPESLQHGGGRAGWRGRSRRPRFRPARSRRSSARRSSRRWTPRAGTSRPPPHCSVCVAPRSTRRCESTTSRSAGLDVHGAPNGPQPPSVRRAPARARTAYHLQCSSHSAGARCSLVRLARAVRWFHLPRLAAR